MATVSGVRSIQGDGCIAVRSARIWSSFTHVGSHMAAVGGAAAGMAGASFAWRRARAWAGRWRSVLLCRVRSINRYAMGTRPQNDQSSRARPPSAKAGARHRPGRRRPSFRRAPLSCAESSTRTAGPGPGLPEASFNPPPPSPPVAGSAERVRAHRTHQTRGDQRRDRPHRLQLQLSME
jgi:hypothetical protein